MTPERLPTPDHETTADEREFDPVAVRMVKGVPPWPTWPHCWYLRTALVAAQFMSTVGFTILTTRTWTDDGQPGFTLEMSSPRPIPHDTAVSLLRMAGVEVSDQPTTATPRQPVPGVYGQEQGR